MKLFVQIDLDETWDEYKNIPLKLLIEDLFGKFPKKDGIKNIIIENIKP